jgi:hypothetical protein
MALLRYARDVAQWILQGSLGEAPRRPMTPGRFGGAFVSFYSGKRLRGCVGTFGLTEDLAATLAEVTAASLRDPRFESNPIALPELAQLTIELSILTEPRRTENPLELIPGRHGLLIRRGLQSGCFLPQVAIERGWSAEQFLSQCCTMKAGLPADAWRDPETRVHVFTAEVLVEEGGL